MVIVSEGKNFLIEYSGKIVLHRLKPKEFIAEFDRQSKQEDIKKLDIPINPMFRHPDFFFLLFFDADYADLR